MPVVPVAVPLVSLEDLKRQAEDLRRQAEIEQELSLARDIQQGLLLEAVPRLPGWEMSAISLPARDLGGDLYDFLPLESGLHGLMIADVSGKGLPAALRMAVARTVFRHEARHGEAPGPTLAAVNRSVLREIPQGMITMLYATLDTRRGLLRVANAGHNYPILINRGVGELEISGLPLGVDHESEYTEIGATIAPGETIVLYTDGVIEATNNAEELFGYERLEQLLQRHERLRPRALMAILLQEVRAWSEGRQSDDVTVVVIRRRLVQVGIELRELAEEVLGVERAMQLWEALPAPADAETAETWAIALPELIRESQARFGRGLTRELHGQLRLALEEYRHNDGESGANHDR
jgi:sigma-B regulation protein RsbU (phosphoserine phosphatase)